jgi:YidC/Oxa1 family membrane protein insertase
MEKKTLLAVALSLGFLLLWSFWSNRNQKNAQQTASVPAATVPAATAPATPGPAMPVPDSVPARVPETVNGKASGTIIPVSNGALDLELDSLGGGIRSAKLPRFVTKSNKELDLLGKRLVGPAAFSLLSADGVPEQGVYKTSRPSSGRVVFTRTSDGKDGLPRGLTIEKEYLFSTNSYLFELTVRFRNTTPQAIVPSSSGWSRFRTAFGIHSPKTKRSNQYDMIVMSYCRGGDKKQVNSEDKIKKKFAILDWSQDYEWAALADRYFILSLVASDRDRSRRPVFAAGNEAYSVSFEENMPDQIAPGATATYRYYVYAGPKDRDIFRAYRKLFKDAAGLVSFEQAMGFNKVIGPVSNVLFDILDFLYRIVKSYGWSIILVTILIKVVFFPLSYKQYESMARMKDLQPAINGLKERYKNDAQGLNRETMNLYKKHKINPLGGCLPMLLQIPVFFAFYDLLSKSVKLRDVSFFWIKDLASPDTVAIISGFPINILPLLMAATTLVQQSFTTGMDPQQKKMMMFMPLVFLFIFWSMPAGLTLYWTVQNILGIGEQLLIQYRMKKKKAHANA